MQYDYLIMSFFVGNPWHNDTGHPRPYTPAASPGVLVTHYHHAPLPLYTSCNCIIPHPALLCLGAASSQWLPQVETDCTTACDTTLTLTPWLSRNRLLLLQPQRLLAKLVRGGEDGCFVFCPWCRMEMLIVSLLLTRNRERRHSRHVTSLPMTSCSNLHTC